jgi:hypothetical protein
VPLVIPIIITGGILTGWLTRTEAGLVAVVYILVVAIPVLNWRHIRELSLDFAKAGLLYSIPLITVAAASAFGWMLAYLRGPDLVSDWITTRAGTDQTTIMFLLAGAFVIIGDFVDAIPVIIIFIPIINKLTEIGGINPVHMGVVIIVTLALRPDHAALRHRAVDGREIRGRAVLGGAAALIAALCGLLRGHRLLHLLSGRRALAPQARTSGIRRLFQELRRHRTYLPGVMPSSQL